MNADVRILLADAERALRGDDLAAARTAFLEAGQCAAGYRLWRGAMRCYRRALELDLADREPVHRVAPMRRSGSTSSATGSRSAQRRGSRRFAVAVTSLQHRRPESCCLDVMR